MIREKQKHFKLIIDWLTKNGLFIKEKKYINEKIFI